MTPRVRGRENGISKMRKSWTKLVKAFGFSKGCAELDL
jgi:hypothetical protein